METDSLQSEQRSIRRSSARKLSGIDSKMASAISERAFLLELVQLRKEMTLLCQLARIHVTHLLLWLLS